MNQYDIYKIIEFIIFLSYLIFIFLSIQIWFLWKNRDELKLRSGIDGSFIRRNYIYLSMSILFLMIHELFESAGLPYSTDLFELSEMIGLIFLVLVVYEWYRIFKKSVETKPDTRLVK